MELQGVTGSNGVTGRYKGLKRVTRVTGGCKEFQGVTRASKG